MLRLNVFRLSVFRPKMFCMISLLVSILIPLTLNAQTPDAGEPDTGEPKAPLYRHPLLDRALPDGGVPGLDLKDDAAGRRYVVRDAAAWPADGQAAEESGVASLTRHRWSDAERQARRLEKTRDHGPPAAEEDDVDKLGETLANALAAAGPERRLLVAVWLEDPLIETLADAIDRAIARGEVRSLADRRAVEEEWLGQRRQQIEAAQRQVLATIGGQLIYRCSNLPCFTATLLGAEIRGLAERTEVERLDLMEIPPQNLSKLTKANAETGPQADGETPGDQPDPMPPPAGNCTPTSGLINGRDVLIGTQIEPFVADGFDGIVGDESGAAGDPLRLAVIEGFGGGRANDGHPGFRDSASGPRRILKCLDCDGSGCTTPSGFSYAEPHSNHATFVNGLAWGDLRDGQDPHVTTTTERVIRSGYAGEARAHLYAADVGEGHPGASQDERRATIPAILAALDDIAGNTPLADAVNMAWSADRETDDECRGKNALSRAANDLFENGIPFIKSAGNYGAPSATNCTVGSPGSAIGAFTVGGHCTEGDGGVSEVRRGSLHPDSSQGGVSWDEGRDRTIVDVTACLHRICNFTGDGGYQGGGVSSGTSTATPTVSGGAIDFIDFYKHRYSNLIDRPGILYANLLLMGDRQAQCGFKGRGFDPRWGAGRLLMRRFDPAGIDAPAAWATGHLCVDDGETVILEVNGGQPLSADVDDFKAVIYWYDPRHERGKRISDVDLRLETVDGTLLEKSITHHDNKERVFDSTVGGKAIQLKIEGYDVRTDDTGCGRNSMRVYFAWLFEDDARNDANGPGSEIMRERAISGSCPHVG